LNNRAPLETTRAPVSLLIVTTAATASLAWIPGLAARAGTSTQLHCRTLEPAPETAEPAAPVSLDETLLERARRGDGRAFRTIFERHGGAIRRFLRDLLRDESAADEATQESFVRAHRGLGRIADGAKLRPFLFGIARNVARERMRAGARERPLDDDEGAVAQLGHAPSPEALLMAVEADQVLAAALAELGPERRAALLLRLDHDLGYPEIAEAMGWSVAKVKNEIHRGRGRIRATILAYLGEAR
jgi:RNA polymerase sigma-70 factor, ECF subfamily